MRALEGVHVDSYDHSKELWKMKMPEAIRMELFRIAAVIRRRVETPIEDITRHEAGHAMIFALSKSVIIEDVVISTSPKGGRVSPRMRDDSVSYENEILNPEVSSPNINDERVMFILNNLAGIATEMLDKDEKDISIFRRMAFIRGQINDGDIDRPLDIAQIMMKKKRLTQDEIRGLSQTTTVEDSMECAQALEVIFKKLVAFFRKHRAVLEKVKLCIHEHQTKPKANIHEAIVDMLDSDRAAFLELINDYINLKVEALDALLIRPEKFGIKKEKPDWYYRPDQSPEIMKGFVIPSALVAANIWAIYNIFDTLK